MLYSESVFDRCQIVYFFLFEFVQTFDFLISFFIYYSFCQIGVRIIARSE